MPCGDPYQTRRHNHTGGLLIELLLALALGVVLLGAFAGVLAACLRWTRALVERAEALEVVRTVWVVLDDELRPGAPDRDWRVLGPEVVALRAFRGVARVCLVGSSGGWAVAFRGRRLPDPDRGDSVLVLGSDGGWRAFRLERSDPGGECELEDGEAALLWTWSNDSAPPPVLARLFERGEYHLADGALRYRRGGGGRQPLTPERLGAGSSFGAIPGGVEVRLEFRAEADAGDLSPFWWTSRPAPSP